jgi:septal ring factor EnvC (AmiA/AmiB activator)
MQTAQPKDKQQTQDNIMKNIKQIALIAFLAAAMTPAASLRAAESGDRAKETKARIDSTRSEVAKIRNQVGVTLEELHRLKKDNVDLRAQLQKYEQELVNMETQAGVARDRVISMESKGMAYFQAWEDEIASISNKDIRDQAQSRYNKRVKSYNKIIKAMTEARDQLKPFMSDLNDVKKLLGSELSRESVKSASSLIRQASWHGEDVVESLKDVEGELDRVSAELAKYK